jgi:hypothetical protein
VCSSDLRIFSYDWNDYSADKVVFHPKHMSADRLWELLAHAWDTFYHDESQAMKMSRLFAQVIRKEMADHTFRPRQRALRQQAFGRSVGEIQRLSTHTARPSSSSSPDPQSD